MHDLLKDERTGGVGRTQEQDRNHAHHAEWVLSFAQNHLRRGLRQIATAFLSGGPAVKKNLLALVMKCGDTAINGDYSIKLVSEGRFISQKQRLSQAC